jgi:hypothetical protein
MDTDPSYQGFHNYSCDGALALCHVLCSAYSCNYTNRVTLVGTPQPVDSPELVWFAIEANVTAAANGPQGGKAAATTEVYELSLPISGPVFNLPPGFTANSSDGLIVDNRYVPEPDAALAQLAALAAIALVRWDRADLARRRRPSTEAPMRGAIRMTPTGRLSLLWAA